MVDLLGQKQPGECGGVLGAEHPELVERVPGVVEQVGIGRRGHRGAVVGRERGRDLLGVVDEVQHEGAVFVLVGPVQPG